MKELFTGLFSVSLSGSLVICLVLVLRLFFKKAPKALICALWALTILRLLLPIQIENPISLRPETPVLSSFDTQLFIDSEPVPEDAIPGFIPQKKVDYDLGTKIVLVDYVAVAAGVWACVACGIVLYMLISYLRLKLRVRDAVCSEGKVYTTNRINTAFLLGYLQPRIYLPSGMEAEEQRLVVAHERAHIKRGDNWLKLIGYICLAVHWYNPLVWISYFLLCKDIEDACDELVVRDLTGEERKTYSKALLSCGRERAPLAACPVAFGEISIKQRILNILNYRKPSLWICILAVIAIVLTVVLFMTDPFVQKNPPHYEALTQLLGHPVEEVFEKFDLSEGDMVTESDRDYGKTPIQVEYQGITFNIYFRLDRSNEHLAGFSYVAAYDDLNQAAKDTVTLSRHLWKCYGEGYQAEHRDDPERLSHITVEEVREMFNNPRRAHVGISTVGDLWDITDQAGDAVNKYLEEYQNSEAWQFAYGPESSFADTVVSPGWRVQFSAWSDADSESDTATAYITLRYEMAIMSDPGKYIAATFAVKQNWWDKLLNWLK